MQVPQIVYKQTISYKSYHSISVEATADIESMDNLEESYRNLSSWVSKKIKQSAENEAPERPKPLKPEDIY